MDAESPKERFRGMENASCNKRTSTKIPSSRGITFSGDPFVYLFGQSPCLEVSDTLQSCSGNVAIQAPEHCLIVGNLLAVFPALVVELTHAMNLIPIKAGHKATGF